MTYFIAINGKVYSNNFENKHIPRLDIENNLFKTRDEAHLVAFELEEQHPRIFYGKFSTKEGLLADERGDSTQAYRKRR